MCRAAPEDTECDTCTKEQCCNELIACEDDSDCICMFDCVEAMGLDGLAACQASCEVMGVPELMFPLLSCRAMSCAASGC